MSLHTKKVRMVCRQMRVLEQTILLRENISFFITNVIEFHERHRLHRSSETKQGKYLTGKQKGEQALTKAFLCFLFAPAAAAREETISLRQAAIDSASHCDIHHGRVTGGNEEGNLRETCVRRTSGGRRAAIRVARRSPSASPWGAATLPKGCFDGRQ